MTSLLMTFNTKALSKHAQRSIFYQRVLILYPFSFSQYSIMDAATILWLDGFLNSQDELKPLNLSNKTLKQYVCRSLTQENKGVTDMNTVHRIIHNQMVDEDETIEFKDTIKFIEAYKYLHKLSKDENGGLLENNILYDVHKLLMNHHKSWCTVGKYSIQQRIVEFQGQLHYYVESHFIDSQMQMLIDEYNRRWTIIKYEIRRKDSTKALSDLMQLSAWFVNTFLQIHPFSDGNGRSVQLLYTYILEAYGFPFPIPLFWTSDHELEDREKAYTNWCQLLWDARMTGELLPLENHMAQVLKKCCQEYEIHRMNK